MEELIGLNIPHPYLDQGIDKIKAHKKYRGNDGYRIVLICMLKEAQIEVGYETPTL